MNGRDTKIPQSGGPPIKVGDEAVHKELGDRMERAATTASSLEVEQDSDAQTRFEAASKSPMTHLSQELTHLEVGRTKSEGSEGFHQIIDFLNVSHIQYALTENPTIYVSFIKQFWRTTTARTSANGEVELTATIDGQEKSITEASLRRHLKLEDNGGVTTLPNSEIFEQLALMRAPETSPSRITSSPSLSPQHTPVSTLSTSQPPNTQPTPNAEEAVPMPHESPLHSVHSLGRDEGRATAQTYFSYWFRGVVRQDRQDVMDLYRLVEERYATSRPEGYDLILWGDLKILFQPDEEDEVWRHQHEYNLISWRLFDSRGIHILLMDNGIAIHMMIEKKYPLTQEMLSKMLSRKLEVDHETEMAFELLRFIRVLDEEQLAFLVDLGITDGQDNQPTIIHNAAFHTDDLDAYDSDCDDISSAKAVLMANLSSYSSVVLSKLSKQMSNHVTNWDKANQETKNVNESLTTELEDIRNESKNLN
ncbi:hypothetical protein Tco_1019483 [Tanacetum coccineum]|uniref:Uncharacterized protein n=1 Tax=Tanacetum coccineum TaxID=301880 RepID=A0ABQ5FYR6_9ASTR